MNTPLNKKLKRIKHLLGKYQFSVPTDVRFEIESLFDELGMDETTRKEYISKFNKERDSTRKEYEKKPLKERKDNKATMNFGSGGSNRSSIRFPSLKRGKAWKNFFKLFPHTDPNVSRENTLKTLLININKELRGEEYYYDSDYNQISLNKKDILPIELLTDTIHSKRLIVEFKQYYKGIEILNCVEKYLNKHHFNCIVYDNISRNELIEYIDNKLKHYTPFKIKK